VTPREALDRAVERWNAGDLAGYLGLYADGAVVHGYAAEPLGRDDLVIHYGGVFAAFGDLRTTVEDVVDGGDKLAVRYTLSGTHTGDFLGLAATGTEISVIGLAIMRFEGERVVERWSVSDTLDLLTQLDASPGKI
jgi:predicted ester cyclase